jgi:hypothetical protein
MAKGYHKTQSVMPRAAQAPAPQQTAIIDTGYTPTEYNDTNTSPLAKGSTLDTNDPGASFEYKKETKDELHSRLRIQEKEVTYKGIKEIVLLGIVIIVAIAILIFCAVIIADKNSIPENRQAAWAAITLILGSFLGYLSGKSSK